MVQCEELKDDDRPSNTLEYFAELSEVLSMIDSLHECSDKSFEKEYEKFTEILSRYQEQPHLLDAHLEVLLEKLLALVCSPNSPEILVHRSFKYLYTLSKVRTYKALVQFLPHELTDLEFALDLLERQDRNDSENWETRYMLIIWMSILVLNPFHMSRLDAFSSMSETKGMDQPKSKMERIYDICKEYAATNDPCSSVAAFLSAKYFIRADIKDIFLGKFLNWVMENHLADTVDAKYGALASVATILKLGKREDLLPYADSLLKWILSCNYKTSSDFLRYKYYVKIVQRLGLVYLKPRLAAWRYKRGKRSLEANLMKNSNSTHELEFASEILEEEEDDEVTVPDTIEEVIEELLQGLRSASSDIRWSSAKGIGRVTNRLPKTLGDEVVGSIVDMFDPLEPHEAWHGACLAIAELAKRGLLLPYRLKVMVPLLLQALVYDEMKGYMSVGQHIRDASCYMCWAFARAYDVSDIQPFINQIAAGLLTTAVFDREINCRRAAAAAFQESVGRLGNFPYGIEISTTTDFYTVGLRSNSYLQISEFIAQFEEYTKPLIEHLVEKKVNHWDTAIRELAAKAMHNLTKRAPELMATEALPKLFAATDSINVNTRHGAVLAIGEIVLALNKLEIESATPNKYLSNIIVNDLNNLVAKFQERDQFRGMSGEIMKQCCIDFIANCSRAMIPASDKCIESWQQIIDKCIINKSAQIREPSTIALGLFCNAYYGTDEKIKEREQIVEAYIQGSINDLEEHIRMGYLSGLGAFPDFMIRPKLELLVNTLIAHALLPVDVSRVLNMNDKYLKVEHENPITNGWSESRRDSIKALASVVQTIGFNVDDVNSFANKNYLEKVFACYLRALEEYTIDDRGDIGAWVREAVMCALSSLVLNCPHHLLEPNLLHEIMCKFVQIAVEKIDRTRGLAGKLFCNLVHANPPIPHIRRHDRLREIMPEDSSGVLWLFADHTFPLFCSMLELPEYSQRIILGLSASIGQLTESLIKYSSASLFQFLRSHPNEMPRICKEIVKVFEENLLNERVTYPLLNFLDTLLSSGTINSVLMDENSDFADEIFRLVNTEVKGHKKLYKMVSSINVFAQLIQVPRLCTKVFSKLSLFLGLTHVHIRKTTATKLYEALVLHGDVCGISEENLDQALALLSEVDWGQSLNEIRPIRNELCNLIGIKPPVSATTAATASIAGTAK